MAASRSTTNSKPSAETSVTYLLDMLTTVGREQLWKSSQNSVQMLVVGGGEGEVLEGREDCV